MCRGLGAPQGLTDVADLDKCGRLRLLTCAPYAYRIERSSGLSVGHVLGAREAARSFGEQGELSGSHVRVRAARAGTAVVGRRVRRGLAGDPFGCGGHAEPGATRVGRVSPPCA